MTAALAAPEAKRFVAELDRVEADGTFTGHACLFGVEDLARDVVEPGAFRTTLARRGAGGVKMLWHHDPAEPIGRWLEIREDDRGLFVRGRILTDVARGREALALMRAGVLDGLSIGFRTVKGRRDARSGIRSLAEIDLWEISLVTFPMQPAARVASVEAARGLGRDISAADLTAIIRRAAALFHPER
jgi:HK97 family phage prohead protease